MNNSANAESGRGRPRGRMKLSDRMNKEMGIINERFKAKIGGKAIQTRGSCLHTIFHSNRKFKPSFAVSFAIFCSFIPVK